MVDFSSFSDLGATLGAMGGMVKGDPRGAIALQERAERKAKFETDKSRLLFDMVTTAGPFLAKLSPEKRPEAIVRMNMMLRPILGEAVSVEDFIPDEQAPTLTSMININPQAKAVLGPEFAGLPGDKARALINSREFQDRARQTSTAFSRLELPLVIEKAKQIQHPSGKSAWDAWLEIPEWDRSTAALANSVPGMRPYLLADIDEDPALAKMAGVVSSRVLAKRQEALASSIDKPHELLGNLFKTLAPTVKTAADKAKVAALLIERGKGTDPALATALAGALLTEEERGGAEADKKMAEAQAIAAKFPGINMTPAQILGLMLGREVTIPGEPGALDSPKLYGEAVMSFTNAQKLRDEAVEVRDFVANAKYPESLLGLFRPLYRAISTGAQVPGLEQMLANMGTMTPAQQNEIAIARRKFISLANTMAAISREGDSRVSDRAVKMMQEALGAEDLSVTPDAFVENLEDMIEDLNKKEKKWGTAVKERKLDITPHPVPRRERKATPTKIKLAPGSTPENPQWVVE